ncbi:MAG: UxaA family hydrolase [Lachnospirales bacterium]
MIKSENAVMIVKDDNVAVATRAIKNGEDVFGVTAKGDIPFGHKIALSNIAKNSNILKYGYAIGHATTDISAGDHVHVHNVKTNLNDVLEYEYKPQLKKINYETGTFKGYKREDGRVGTRNEIWIVNTVGCVNKISTKIANMANEKHSGKVDGVYSFEHPFGCSQLGDDHEYTKKILARMVNHPNAGGVLVLGLGCENNTIKEFKKEIGEYNSSRVKFIITQEHDDEISACMEAIDQLVDYAKNFTRTDEDLSKLVVGLKCGGSDGFSGITANPLVGMFSDMLVQKGGTTILTEVPEMFGAETILMNRCETKELFDETVSLINNFKRYFQKYNQVVYENPSPGNKDGGITTLEDKSLGCTQKCGTSNVIDVLDYGDIVKKSGLNLLQSPGNDIVAITTLMAAGANIILFTTGRGTPIGAPVPTIKISSNSDLATRKSNWIDFDASRILDDVKTVSTDFFDFVLKVANGEKAKNEINEYREISIFKDGVTL